MQEDYTALRSAEMDYLTEALSAATETTRELEYRIAFAFDHPEGQPWKSMQWTRPGSRLDKLIPKYLTSIDDALSLGRTPVEAFDLIRDAISAAGKRHHLHTNFFDGSINFEISREIILLAIQARQNTR